MEIKMPLFTPELKIQIEKFLEKNPDIKSAIEDLENSYEKKDNKLNSKVEILRKKLIKILDTGKNNDAYALAVELTKAFPLNEKDSDNKNIDPITQVDPIPDIYLFPSSNGFYFDIYTLIKSHITRPLRSKPHSDLPKKLYINPITNLPFNANDVLEIKKLDIENNISESVMNEIKAPSDKEGCVPIDLHNNSHGFLSANFNLSAILGPLSSFTLLPPSIYELANIPLGSFHFIPHQGIFRIEDEFETDNQIQTAIRTTLNLHPDRHLNYLSLLPAHLLFEVCSETATSKPEISISVFSEDSLRDKLTDVQQSIIIEKNICIATTIYYAGVNIVSKLGSDALFAICEKTVSDDPKISIEILSDFSLRNKMHNMFQSSVIRSNFIVAKTLYENGFNFLKQLDELCLIAICKTTAKEKPEISVDLIFNFPTKISQAIRREIFEINPQVAILLERKKQQSSNNNNNNASPPPNLPSVIPFLQFMSWAASGTDVGLNSEPFFSGNSNNNNNSNRFFSSSNTTKPTELQKALEPLSPEQLYNLCLNNAKEQPETSVLVLGTPALRNKLLVQQQATLICSNYEIAYQLGIKSNHFLSQFHGDCLEAICRITVKKDYVLSSCILSDKVLRDKISDKYQALIIRANANLARDLFEKGDSFLQELQPKTLVAICLATAKSNPEIGKHILSTKELSSKIEPNDRELIKNLINESFYASLNSTNHPSYASPSFR